MGKVTLKANQVRGAISGMVADITVLSDLASLKRCLRFKCASGADLEALESELTTFAEAHQQYTQFRVLSSDGMELLRWNYDRDKKRVTRIHELQDKSNRYYVKNTLEMPVGGTYISKIDHNIENGSLQIPLIPTVRAARKMDSGTSQYLIVLNRDLSPSIDATVGETFTYADADADAPYLRLMYERDKSTQGFDTASRFVPIFSVTENADTESLNSFPADLKRLNPEYINNLENEHIVIREDSGSTAVLNEAVVASTYRGHDSHLLVVGYLPDSYLIESYLKERWSFILAVVALIVGVMWLLFSVIRKNIELEGQEQQLETFVEQLKGSVDDLRQTRERQAQMLSVVSHELRTPLSSSHMIFNQLDADNLDHYLPTLRANSESVLSIMDDLRMVIQPDTVRIADKTLDVPALIIERTVASLSNLASQHNVTVHVSFDSLSAEKHSLHVAGLRQIVTNLTKNAFLHAEASNVWVSATATQTDTASTELTVCVEDDGKGISEAFQQTMFEAFSRGDTKGEGTGLGLYVISELTAALSGEITYFPSLKGGAGFKLTVKLEPENEQAEMNEPTISEDVLNQTLAGKTVLFAEDQLTIQMLTKNVLTKAGAEVTVASNGQLAMEAYSEASPDIVITDVMMPEMDGYQLSAQLREAGYPGPIIAVTAATIGDERDRLLAAGADAVLPKPINLDQLKLTLASSQNNQGAA